MQEQALEKQRQDLAVELDVKVKAAVQKALEVANAAHTAALAYDEKLTAERATKQLVRTCSRTRTSHIIHPGLTWPPHTKTQRTPPAGFPSGHMLRGSWGLVCTQGMRGWVRVKVRALGLGLGLGVGSESVRVRIRVRSTYELVGAHAASLHGRFASLASLPGDLPGLCLRP